jgi:hypothetical protein
MTEHDKAQEDLRYVRNVLHRAETEVRSPASIYFLWAVISFFGYAIIDYAPEKTGFYWMVAGPLGGVLSGILGHRAGLRSGLDSARDGIREMLHWTTLLVGALLVIPLAATGALAPAEIPRIILLLLAVTYFTAGIHLDRRMAPIGIVLAGCYLLTVFARDLPYLWTLTAVILAASLVAAGLAAAMRDRRPPAPSAP